MPAGSSLADVAVPPLLGLKTFLVIYSVAWAGGARRQVSGQARIWSIFSTLTCSMPCAIPAKGSRSSGTLIAQSAAEPEGNGVGRIPCARNAGAKGRCEWVLARSHAPAPARVAAAQAGSVPAGARAAVAAAA